MNDIVKLIIFSFTSVVYLFIISKFLGKKQIAQLDFIDYVMGISIGSIASEMATDIDETPFYYYIIAMTVFFLFDIFVTFVGRKGSFLKRFFNGKPETIIYEGKLNYNAIKRTGLDLNDIIGMCREQGYFDISKISFAVLETSGNMSIMPIATQRAPTISDLKSPKIMPATLPYYVVIDGAISHSSLTNLGKDKNWLFKQLGVSTKKQLKKILLAIYDQQNKKMIIHYKRKNV